LLLDPDAQNVGNVVTLQDNDDSVIINAGTPQDPLDWSTVAGFLAGDVPITVTEQGPNSGVFGTFDESDTSNIVITDDAQIGTSATIDYNETPTTILVLFGFASIDLIPPDDEWNSGEEVTVQLVDSDANQNSRADEDLDLNNPNVTLIPALKTGSPATLSNLDVAIGGTIFGGTDVVLDEIQAVSDRAILEVTGSTAFDGDTLILTFGTMADFFNAAPVNDASFRGVALLNYDFRSLSNAGNLDTLDSIDLTLNGVLIGDDVALQGLILIDDTTGGGTLFGGITSTDPLVLTVTLNMFGPSSIPAGTLLPMVADIFGFGFTDDGVQASERVANQIIRLELEETGDNTSTFEGTLEYTMVNQLNILDPATYTGLKPIDNFPTFVVIEDLTAADSPQVNYLDLDGVGASVQISDAEAAPTHSGDFSFDNNSYNPGDTVTLTVSDMDLSVDSFLIDIFTVVDGTLFADPARDTVGLAGLPVFSFGPLGQLLEVTFDGVRWQESATCLPTGGADSGLGASGFAMIETTKDSGVFTGSFQFPTNFCRNGETVPESTAGLDIGANYVDFRDASGEIVKISKIASIPICVVPPNGDWTITEDCVLSMSAQFSGNVIVQGNSVLIIPDGITFTINSGNSVIVVSGSGILIRDGGTLIVLV